MPDVFDSILGQASVRDFLRCISTSQRYSHAYLFVGPVGSNRMAAALAFAQSLICNRCGCGQCEACRRVLKGTHPDIHVVEPEGASGYLLEQIRFLVEDVSLAPVRADKKVYILKEADRLTVSSANAFLKTLEEPPEDVIFILLGRTSDGILPTIASRCQIVPFRHIPPSEAAGLVSQNAGVTITRARASLDACGGSIARAISFSRSNERQEFRQKVFEVLLSLEHADSWDVIRKGKKLVLSSKAALDSVRAAQELELAEKGEFVQGSARKQMELKSKRILSSLERESLAQLFALTESWLRDMLAISVGTSEQITNEDMRSALLSSANNCDICGITAALRRTGRLASLIAYNVSPQTCVEVLLLGVKEDLYGCGVALSRNRLPLQ